MPNHTTQSIRLPKGIGIILVIPLAVYLFLWAKDPALGSRIPILMAIFVLLIFTVNFRLSIDDTAIRYKLFPIHLKYRTIFWKDIKAVEFVALNALTGFNGYGLRYSKKLGWGYIFDTKETVRVQLNSGKTVYFSIKDKDAFIDLAKSHLLVQ